MCEQRYTGVVAGTCHLDWQPAYASSMQTIAAMLATNVTNQGEPPCAKASQCPTHSVHTWLFAASVPPAIRIAAAAATASIVQGGKPGDSAEGSVWHAIAAPRAAIEGWVRKAVARLPRALHPKALMNGSTSAASAHSDAAVLAALWSQLRL